MVLISMVNRAVRIWSLKEKKLKSTMRGHTDEIEVIFFISSAKEFSVNPRKIGHIRWFFSACRTFECPFSVNVDRRWHSVTIL